MKKELLFPFLILLPAILLGQTKYKFEYKRHLKSAPSTFTIQTSDTVLAANKSLLTFHILDIAGEPVSFANISIKNSVTNLTIQSDMNGDASAPLASGNFSIVVLSGAFTAIHMDSLFVKERTKTVIKTSLRPSNALSIVHVYSVRKLTKYEIEKLIDDLSNDRKDISLIKNKTCYVVWEI